MKLLRILATHWVLGASALLWACNMQPSGGGGGAPAPALSPDPAASGTVRSEPAPEQRYAPRRARPLAPVPRVRPTGPQASQPAPLPRDGVRVAIFHSGNVEGELDPCG